MDVEQARPASIEMQVSLLEDGVCGSKQKQEDTIVVDRGKGRSCTGRTQEPPEERDARNPPNLRGPGNIPGDIYKKGCEGCQDSRIMQ